MLNEYFVFYNSYYEAIKELDCKKQQRVMIAICEYALFGTEPKLNGVEKAIFTLIKPTIDANAKRRENAKKGGCPKGNQNAKKTTVGCFKDIKETTDGCSQKQPNVKVKEEVEEEVEVKGEEEVKDEVVSGAEISAPVSPSPSPNFEKLIYDYGQENVDNYIQRVRSWYKDKGKSPSDLEGTVRKWLEQDGIEKIDHSIDKYNCIINKF